MLFGILLLLIVCIILVQNAFPYFKRYLRILYKAHKCQPLHGYLPILGHAIRLYSSRKNVHALIKDACQEANDIGSISVFWFGPVPYFVVTDPEDVLTVSNKCVNRATFYDLGVMLIGRNLLNSNDQAWKSHRKMINPAFSKQVLDTYINVFNDASKDLLQSIEKSMADGYVDTVKPINYFTLDVLTKTVLGVDADVIPRESFGKFIHNLATATVIRLATLIYHIDSIFKMSKLYKEMAGYGKTLNSITRNLIVNKLSKIKEETACNMKIKDKKLKSAMDILLERHLEGELSTEDLIDELNFIILAGYDTNLCTLTMILSIIGMHTEVQDKLYEEIRNVLGDTDRDLDKDDYSKLRYTSAVIKECLRFYPAVPIIARSVSEDVQLKNITLPAGSQIILGLYGTQIHNCWGEDRLEFKPERWLNKDDLPFASFSMGRRNCVGKQYAMMSMETALVHIVRKYHMQKEKKELEFYFEIISKPVSGYKIKFTLRENQV